MPQQYIDDIRHVRYQVPEGVSDTAADLISRLLVLEPQKRLSCEQIAQHPWMREKICGAPLSNRFMVPVDEENLAGAKSRKQQRKRVGNVLKRVGIHVLPLNDDGA
jgi:serine/threonine protein kinase